MKIKGEKKVFVKMKRYLKTNEEKYDKIILNNLQEVVQ